MKTLSTLLLILCLAYSCQSTQRKKNESKGSSGQEQVEFDAITHLQLTTDEPNRLYATFPNIEHPCFPADTSFEISQSELLLVMKAFISKHCKNKTPETQDYLANSAVTGQKHYTVLVCYDEQPNNVSKNKVSKTGTWVLPNVNDTRDIVLVW